MEGTWYGRALTVMVNRATRWPGL